MKLGVLAALDQRIGLRYAMPPMTGEETSSYLRHHITLAGCSDTLFSDDATALIRQTSRGYPRAVNPTCSGCRLGADRLWGRGAGGADAESSCGGVSRLGAPQPPLRLPTQAAAANRLPRPLES